MKTKTKTIIGIVVVIIALAFVAGSQFSVFPVTSKELTFTMSCNKDGTINGGDFAFNSGCEEMQAQTPTLSTSCADIELAKSGNELTTIDESCASFKLDGVGDFDEGDTIEREGYSVTLKKASAEWTYGSFSTVTQDSEGNFKDVLEPGQQLNSCSATWAIELEDDALKTEIQKQSVKFTKELPACVETGAVIADSPRILGATVINNNDGTFTSVGNVQQDEIIFHNSKTGTTSYEVASQEGFHTLVFKPYVVVEDKKIDFLPEKSSTWFREGNSIRSITETERQDIPEPTTWEKFKSFWLKIWRFING